MGSTPIESKFSNGAGCGNAGSTPAESTANLITMNRKQLGDFGEKIAREYLRKKGCRILGNNFGNKWGEIDIVAQKKKTIIFCEVKTIIEKTGFFPEDQVDFKKKQQLRKMSEIYLSKNKISFETPCQIDIIAITVAKDFKNYKINHFENAIENIH